MMAVKACRLTLSFSCTTTKTKSGPMQSLMLVAVRDYYVGLGPLVIAKHSTHTGESFCHADHCNRNDPEPATAQQSR